MEEVEELCDRVIILDRGKILASGTKEELKELSNIEEKVVVDVYDLSENILEEISNKKEVDYIDYTNNVLTITYKKGKNNIGELIDLFNKKKVKYGSITSSKPTLNDVFLELTGKDLRD